MKQQTVIGIDLGGTNCRGALVGANGEIVAPQRIETAIAEGFDVFWARLVDFCRSLMGEGELRGCPVAGLGIGVPGLVARDGTVREAPNLAALAGFALTSRLEAELGIAVRVVNDVNAIALGEAQRGAGRGFGSFLMMTLGTGVGGGLILARQLWYGADGAAGEIGHVVVRPGGYPCGCGSRGCLEQYASGPSILRAFHQLRSRSAMVAPRYARIRSAEEVAAAARQGCEAAQQAFAMAGCCIGQVLAGVANLLNLDGVVIGGGVADSFDLFIPSLRTEIDRRAFGVTAQRLQVVKAALGSQAGILGAAQLVREMI